MTTMQLLCLRLSQLQNEGRMTDAMASLAKMKYTGLRAPLDHEICAFHYLNVRRFRCWRLCYDSSHSPRGRAGSRNHGSSRRGSRTNAGLLVDLLDIVPPDAKGKDRNSIVKAG